MSKSPTERYFEEEAKQLETVETFEKHQQECKNGELTETSTNILVTECNPIEKCENRESVQATFTNSSPFSSEDVESVCSYSHTIRKNRPRKGYSSQDRLKDSCVTSSHSKRRKRINRLKNNSGAEQVANITIPKGVDDLLDNFLLLEGLKEGSKYAVRPVPKYHHRQISNPDDMSSLSAKSETLLNPFYTREIMQARLQYMYSKNIAGQFAFDISDDVLAMNKPFKSKDLSLKKPTRTVKKKATRRLKLRLYLPT
ncbi:hypothetical protein GpartN1_g4872.t1 [Galdieria partita]|uniref:Uncharacterized protein n=1 Tax=Galdieria partita TaxID=83374 RepID=A0A9C7Q061_9RHOD|nr:hypothetical protein GpartN1_g1905.t1 [Galdieria partita]GJQ13081.1 hypothetical protein GpartN1_g4872.t1 [Galdieria partita]